MAALAFERRDRLGDAKLCHMVLELTGKGGNLVLVDGPEPWSGKILDRLREEHSHRSPRRLAAGERYALPAGRRADAAKDGPERLAAALDESLQAKGTSPRALVDAWTGLGPIAAEEVWRLSGASTDPAHLAQVWLAFARDTEPGGPRFRPATIAPADGRAEASCFRPSDETLRALGLEIRHEYPTAAAAVAASHRAFRKRVEGETHTPLMRPVRQAVERTERAIVSLDQDVKDAENAALWRRMGEAILASTQSLPRGTTQASVTDHHTGDALTVDLEPGLSANENADRFFQRARKADAAQGQLPRRRRELEKRLEALGALARDLEAAPGGVPDREWVERAGKLGVKLPDEEIPAFEDAQPEEKVASALRPRRYDLGDGWEVLVGKSNRGNEVLTHEIARPQDTWMHADQSPGSHVVLRHHEKDREPPRELVLRAAAIAAHFSKARTSGKVSILVTLKTHAPSRGARRWARSRWDSTRRSWFRPWIRTRGRDEHEGPRPRVRVDAGRCGGLRRRGSDLQYEPPPGDPRRGGGSDGGDPGRPARRPCCASDPNADPADRAVARNGDLEPSHRGLGEIVDSPRDAGRLFPGRHGSRRGIRQYPVSLLVRWRRTARSSCSPSHLARVIELDGQPLGARTPHRFPLLAVGFHTVKLTNPFYAYERAKRSRSISCTGAEDSIA